LDTIGHFKRYFPIVCVQFRALQRMEWIGDKSKFLNSSLGVPIFFPLKIRKLGLPINHENHAEISKYVKAVLSRHESRIR
jgi:hypothetical protein